MNKYNSTLHKQALQRRKALRESRIKGETKTAWAKRLGLSRKRLYDILGDEKR